MTTFEKKQLFWTRLAALAAACLVLLVLALGVYLVGELRAVERCVTQAEDILTTLSGVSRELENVDWASMTAALNNASGQLQHADLSEIAARLDSVSAALSAIDWTSMAEDVNASLAAAQEGLRRAMEAIDALDIEALNEAIADLNTVIEPLARLINRG